MLIQPQKSNGSQIDYRPPQELAAKMKQPRTLNIGIHLFYSRLVGTKPSAADIAHQERVIDTLRLLDAETLQRTIMVVPTDCSIRLVSCMLAISGINAELVKYIVSPIGEMNETAFHYSLENDNVRNLGTLGSNPALWTAPEKVVLFGCTEVCVGNARKSLLATQKEKGNFKIEVPVELLLLSSQF